MTLPSQPIRVQANDGGHVGLSTLGRSTPAPCHRLRWARVAPEHGSELSDAQWRGVFRQLVALGYAAVDHTAYGALRLSATARPVLRGEQRVEMREDTGRPTRPTRTRRSAAPEGGTPDAELLARLKAWRTDQARRQAIPAYVVLHDATLTEIARRAPRSHAELSEIPGIGEKRLQRYGEELLSVLQQ